MPISESVPLAQAELSEQQSASDSSQKSIGSCVCGGYNFNAELLALGTRKQHAVDDEMLLRWFIINNELEETPPTLAVRFPVEL